MPLPTDAKGEAKAKPALRGRAALRRIRLPNTAGDKAFQTPRLTTFRPINQESRNEGGETVRIVDPSDAAVSYRICTAGLAALGARS